MSEITLFLLLGMQPSGQVDLKVKTSAQQIRPSTSFEKNTLAATSFF